MTSTEIPNIVLEHSHFFDNLVNLVPARYYHDDEAPLQNLKYMKKDARYIAACGIFGRDSQRSSTQFYVHLKSCFTRACLIA